ncbi:hypothetical protein FQR65_LT18243 [Abscondita terminalis]|nr:hypothetical protein FQR65_LT18243 [Abscondita terminalis]
MGTITDRTRTLGWRYRCPAPPHHKKDGTSNTFLERVRLRDVGAHKLLMGMYLWVVGEPLGRMAEQLDIASDQACQVEMGTITGKTRTLGCRYRCPAPPHHKKDGTSNTFLQRVRLRDVGAHKLSMGMYLWVVSEPLGRMAEQLDIASDQDCQVEMGTITGKTRTLGCRYRCPAPPHHKKDGTSNTFLERVCLRDVGNHKLSMDEDPMWIPDGRLHEDCLDKKWVGPPPQADVVPFRVHTNNCKRSWRNLKVTLRSCTSLDHASGYVGEWMYRHNILVGYLGRTAKFLRFMEDLGRAYPGIGRIQMDADILNCQCHECLVEVLDF